MRVIVVGVGKVGYYLTKTLIDKGHEVSLIEEDESRCKRIAEELNILIINGDGTDIYNLADAGADGADVIAAVTGSDEENLVVCQMAKRKFGINKTVARVNNPKNERIFRELGVDIAISSTSIIAKSIESEMDIEDIKTIFAFTKIGSVIVELEMDSNSPAVGRKINEIVHKLPDDVVFVSIFRGNTVIFPKGSTVINDGDILIAFTTESQQEELKNILLGRKRRSNK